ncbi:hypothetical protein BDZ97DRAFT_388674 [Flammula alnicola]|nr:hypothetical protein BDZ97DRAFT_388674 [Flammula alnicola]
MFLSYFCRSQFPVPRLHSLLVTMHLSSTSSHNPIQSTTHLLHSQRQTLFPPGPVATAFVIKYILFFTLSYTSLVFFFLPRPQVPLVLVDPHQTPYIFWYLHKVRIPSPTSAYSMYAFGTFLAFTFLFFSVARIVTGTLVSHILHRIESTCLHSYDRSRSMTSNVPRYLVVKNLNPAFCLQSVGKQPRLTS